MFDGHFVIPDLGPIGNLTESLVDLSQAFSGANGLANPRDFEHPVACYENSNKKHVMFQVTGEH